MWSWGSLLVLGIMQIAYAAIMSRLIRPSEFGLVAAGMVAMKYITYLAQMGIGAALIQRAELERADLVAANTVALLGGFLGCVAALLLSLPLAVLFRQPDVSSVIRWLGLGLLLSAFTTVPEAILRRSMRFRAISIIQVIAYLISNILVATTIALSGYSRAALLSAILVNNIVLAIIYSVLVHWLPRISLDKNRAKRFARFGGLVSITSLMDVISSTADTVAVGRVGSNQLGQYSRATFLVGLPIEQASAAAIRVVAPGLSKIQNDRDRFGSALGVSVGLTAVFVVVPVAIGASAASLLVDVVLGPNWKLAGTILPIVAFAHGISLITQCFVTAADAKGEILPRFWTQFRCLLVTLVFVGLAVTLFGSVYSIAFAWACGEIIRLFLHSRLAIKRLGLDPVALTSRIIGALSLGAASSVPGIVIVRFLHATSLVALSTSLMAGLVAAIVCIVAIKDQPFRKDLAALGAPNWINELGWDLTIR